MRPATLTPASPDARALASRSGLDGATADDAFDSALADFALLASGPTSGAGLTPTVAAVQGGQKGAAVAAVAPVAAMAVVADVPTLLAKLVGGLAAPAIAAKDGAAGRTAADVAPSDDPETASKAAAADQVGFVDPLATLAAAATVVPPGAPVAAEAGAAHAAEAPADPAARTALVSTAMTRPDTTAEACTRAPEDEPRVGLAFVGSAKHLAPVPPAPAASRGTAAVPSAPSKPAAADREPTAADREPTAAGDALASPAAAASDIPTSPAADAVAAPPAPDAKAPAATLQAIAAAITSLAADAGTAVGAAASGDAPPAGPALPLPDPAPAPAAPARSLTLQLSPETLGNVTVRLHLTSGGLDVHLTVDDRKTLASISHARDALAAAIGDNGYRVESLVIRGTDASSTSTAGSHDSARSQSEAGAGTGASSGGGAGRSGDEAPSGRRPPANDAAPSDAGRDRGGDGVFV